MIAVSVHFLMGGSYIATDADGQAVQIHGAHAAWLRGSRPVACAGAIWIFDTRGSAH